MLSPKNLRQDQRDAVLHQLYHPDSMLWMQMGTGKTVVTLTTIEHRMRAQQVQKTLIFGPLRVIQSVWEREARKWAHTHHLRFSVMDGGKERRARAMFSDAEVHLCNYENMNWLAEALDHYYLSQGFPLPYEMVVYDEVSKLKDSTTLRMAGGKRERKDKLGNIYEIKVTGWRKILDHFQYRTGLTGTPASNGYIDLHGQFLAVDGGKRLGTHVTPFKDNYFIADYMGWKYVPSTLGKKAIEDQISDIVFRADAKNMPKLMVKNVMVELPPKARKAYREIETKLFTSLDSGTEIELFAKNSVSNKCLQFANGSPYTDLEGNWERLHDAKLDALEDVLEEAAGQPVLCSYTFKPDAERIMKRFKKYRPVNMSAEPARRTGEIIDRWNRGEIPLMVGHPASMGHGIDGLQDTGHILAWFGLNWSLELSEQMLWRIYRSGNPYGVTVVNILAADTVDLAVADALQRKNDSQQGLKDSVERYRRGEIDNNLEPSFY